MLLLFVLYFICILHFVVFFSFLYCLLALTAVFFCYVSLKSLGDLNGAYK